MGDWTAEWLVGLLVAAAETNPHLVGILATVGLLRVTVKPIMSAIDAYVEWTSGESDDKSWAEFKQGRGMKTALWLIELITSVKVKRGPKP